MHGEGVWADLIKQRVGKTVHRLGLEKRMIRFRQLDIGRFRPPLLVPAAVRHGNGRLDLF